jgi:hypothetical protein
MVWRARSRGTGQRIDETSDGHRPHSVDRVRAEPWFPIAGRSYYHVGQSRSRAICVYGTGSHRQLGAISFEASRRYAVRWEWDVVATCEPDLARGRPASWGKVQLVLELLRTYEWVFLIDADALIVDLDRDVFEGIDPNGGPVWLARHPQGGEPDHVVENAGVMLVHATPDARQFLEDVWAATEFVDHNWWENAAILDLIGRSLEPPYSRERITWHGRLVSQLPLRWNAVPAYIECPDAALHHHARADHDNFALRLAAMEADLLRTGPRP